MTLSCGLDVRALLIEDDADFAGLLEKRLGSPQRRSIALQIADRLDRGIGFLQDGRYDVILLDLLLPDSSGLDTFTHVYTQAPQTPIIILTGLDDEDVAIAAVNAGAQDYLVKGKVDGGQLQRI